MYGDLGAQLVRPVPHLSQDEIPTNLLDFNSLNGYYLLNGECPTSCPSSYYADPIANVCTPCSEIASNSLTCVSEPFDDQALSCAVPYYISQDPDTGDQSCVATCPAGTTAYRELPATHIASPVQQSDTLAPFFSIENYDGSKKTLLLFCRVLGPRADKSLFSVGYRICI